MADTFVQGIINVLDRARSHNPEIGEYVSHRDLPGGFFLVKLTNGTIEMSNVLAGDEARMKGCVPAPFIGMIAQTFVGGK